MKYLNSLAPLVLSAVTSIAQAQEPKCYRVDDSPGYHNICLQDKNHDGRYDHVATTWYNGRRQLVQHEEDVDMDGKVDSIWKFFYDANGAEIRREHDIDGDGKPDRVLLPKEGWRTLAKDSTRLAIRQQKDRH